MGKITAVYNSILVLWKVEMIKGLERKSETTLIYILSHLVRRNERRRFHSHNW